MPKLRRAAAGRRPPGLPNNLESIRTEEGIKRAALARQAELADKTVKRVEDGDESTAVTLHSILNALNALRKKPKRATDYTFKEVFPNHKGAAPGSNRAQPRV
jgi:predicted transcriptional regulator